jgi:hypothetical protein
MIKKKFLICFGVPDYNRCPVAESNFQQGKSGFQANLPDSGINPGFD